MIHHSPVSPENARRRMVRWAAVTAAGAAAIAVLAIYSLTAISRQDRVIDQQNDVIAQVCRAAGGQVEVDPSARLYCERVASGLPAVDKPASAVAGAEAASMCPRPSDDGADTGSVRDRPVRTLPRHP